MVTISYADLDSPEVRAAADYLMRIEDERFYEAMLRELSSPNSPRWVLKGRSMGKSTSFANRYLAEQLLTVKKKKTVKPRSNPLLTALLKRTNDES